jgi:hypothetical protein
MGELRTRLSGPVIDTDDDAVGLARFYAQLLGWRVADQGREVDGRSSAPRTTA